MARFIVVDEAEGYEDPEGFSEGVEDWNFPSYLVDTKTNEIVFKDGGEPEDASLTRDYRRLVDLLNKVAEE